MEQPEYDSLARALVLAGQTAAHAIWSVSDGSPLIPLYAWERDEQLQQERLVVADSAEALKQGEIRFARNSEASESAVLVADLFFRDATGRRDAIQVALLDRVSGTRLTLLIP